MLSTTLLAWWIIFLMMVLPKYINKKKLPSSCSNMPQHYMIFITENYIRSILYSFSHSGFFFPLNAYSIVIYYCPYLILVLDPGSSIKAIKVWSSELLGTPNITVEDRVYGGSNGPHLLYLPFVQYLLLECGWEFLLTNGMWWRWWDVTDIIMLYYMAKVWDITPMIILCKTPPC